MQVKFNTQSLFRGKGNTTYYVGFQFEKQFNPDNGITFSPILRSGEVSDTYINLKNEDVPAVVRALNSVAGIHAPNECPVCGQSDGVELSAHPDVHPTEVVCSYECSCGATWNEIFVFNRINVTSNGSAK